MRKLLLLILVLAAAKIHAQELHFSQYFNNPLIVNPANTGFQPDADYRLGINYRNQWASILNNPYKTFSAWGDVQMFTNRFENGWIGLGGVLLRDVAGSGNLTSTKAYGSVAYHHAVSLNSLLSLGFNVGYVSKRIDYTKLTFDNQWNGMFFDNVNIPSGEVFARSSIQYIDLGVGANYAYFPTDDIYINAGISIFHLNRPRESFFSDNGFDNRINQRFNFFANAAIKLNEMWIVNPNIYYSEMTGVREIVGGMNVNYNLSGDGTTQLIGGIYYRTNDAIIPLVGYQWNDLKLTVSYDATSSALSSYNNTRGAYELSLVKTGVFGGFKALKCPPSVKF